MKPPPLRVHALRVEQRPDLPLYVFGIQGRILTQVARAQHAKRAVAVESIEGYQRPEVKAHIRQIRDYLLQDDALLPNAIVLALASTANFVPSEATHPEWGTPGVLTLEVPTARHPEHWSWIVDGQQRMAALADLPAGRMFPVVVSAFASASVEEQREQFVLVNRSRPLPKDLLLELLPEVQTTLPSGMDRDRIAALVVRALRFGEGSPFRGKIKGIGSPESATISQRSVLNAVKVGLQRGGVLQPLLGGDVGAHDIDGMAEFVGGYFAAVESVWPREWAGSPTSSRLVHGVGIGALAKLMSAATDGESPTTPAALARLKSRLSSLSSHCAWTATARRWPAPLSVEWNELQNTGKDKNRLFEHLRVHLVERPRATSVGRKATTVGSVRVSKDRLTRLCEEIGADSYFGPGAVERHSIPGTGPFKYFNRRGSCSHWVAMGEHPSAPGFVFASRAASD